MPAAARGGKREDVKVLDVLACGRERDGAITVAAVNKHPDENRALTLRFEGGPARGEYRVLSVTGESTKSYNDIGVEGVKLTCGPWRAFEETLCCELPPHSVHVIEIRQ